jgi:sugar lactone lactonase YvrE
MRSNRMHGIWSCTLVVAPMCVCGCVTSETEDHHGQRAIVLPERYNTPDGMTRDGEGNIILSVPNFNDPSHPSMLVRIDAEDQIHELIELPIHPETGNPSGPLGVAVGSDGNLYVADNQAFHTSEHKSRLLRVVMRDGEAISCEPVVTGFVMSNGVAAHGDYIYVCESKLEPEASPMPTGVYRFAISELQGPEPLKLEPGGSDPHLAVKFFTQNPDWPVGANGIGFGAQGEMYVCNFGDAQLIKVVFDEEGLVASQEVLAEKGGMACTDGLSIDPETGHVYIADFLGNALHRVDPVTGEVRTIAKNGETDGAGGALDRPSEPCVRGNLVYVANIDLELAGNTSDELHTLSVIALDNDSRD